MTCEAAKVMWKYIAKERGQTPTGETSEIVRCCKEEKHLYHQFELAQDATDTATLVYLERENNDISK